MRGTRGSGFAHRLSLIAWPSQGAGSIRPRSPEDRPGSGAVPTDLVDERLNVPELPLIADSIDEMHPQLRSIEVLVEVEQVRLDHLCLSVEGGPYPDVGDARQKLVCTASASPGVHPAPGDRDPCRHADIRGGYTDRPSPAVARYHRSPHLVEPRECLGCGADVARGDHHPDPRRRNGLVSPDERNDLGLESQAAAQLAQQADVARPIPPEPEVLSHDHDPRPQRAG